MPIPIAHAAAGLLEPLSALPLLVALAAYELRARTLAARAKPVPVWRRACFAAGIALGVAAVASPLAHIAEELILAHMVQHLLVGDLAALLIVLGLTGPILAPVLSLPVIGRLRALAHPAVALPLWVANLYLWHLPIAYQGAVSSGVVHVVQHGCFIGFGVAMWMALLGPLPKPRWFGNGAKLVYVIGVRLSGAVLGNVLMWSGTAFYPDYAAGQAEWGISPLADQGLAGVIMMVEGSLVTVGLFAWLFLRAAREGDERQELLDLAEARGLALAEARATRAVAAGQQGRLRERLTATVDHDQS